MFGSYVCFSFVDAFGFFPLNKLYLIAFLAKGATFDAFLWKSLHLGAFL